MKDNNGFVGNRKKSLYAPKYRRDVSFWVSENTEKKNFSVKEFVRNELGNIVIDVELLNE